MTDVSNLELLRSVHERNNESLLTSGLECVTIAREILGAIREQESKDV